MTLIEVLVSVVMLTIVILGGLQFYVAGSARVDRGVHQRAAFGLAHARLEDVIRAPYDSVTSLSEIDLSLGDIVCTRTTAVTYVDDPQDGTGAADTDSNDYKQVVVTVSWAEGGSSRSFTMDTMIAP